MIQKNFSTLVSDMAAAIQGKASKLIDMTVGSVLRAVVEAFASVVVWLESLVLLLLATTRAATSSGADLDSWMADYNFTRLAAVAATGNLTFARFTTTAQAVVPVGATVQTADGTQKFTVTLDTGNVAYNSSLGGYVIAVGVTNVVVPAIALVAGAAGNAIAGQINTLGQAMPGIDTVTNGVAFANGLDAESDVNFRARFIVYLSSLSKGTYDAISLAIKNASPAAQYTITALTDYTTGGQKLGYFYVVADDGSGAPGTTFLNTISAAVAAVRAFTIQYDVFGPNLITANAAMTVTVASGYTAATVKANVQAAVVAGINGLGLGVSMPYSKLAGFAYGVAGVANVTAITLNSGTADITATAKDTVKAGTVTVS